jgi:hypothetical protein
MAVVGCEHETPLDEFNLDELLRKYMGPQPQTWGEGDDIEEVEVYFLDPRRFDAFKAELDAGGEYQQTLDDDQQPSAWEWGPRDRNMGKAWVQWTVVSNGSRFQLDHYKADNSVFGYEYEKVPGTSGLKLDELLRKYMGPQPQTWGEGDDIEEVEVYFLDPRRFDAFKDELEAGGEYIRYDSENYTRDWDTGKAFARVGVRTNTDDGSKIELNLAKADNSTLNYRYIKIP